MAAHFLTAPGGLLPGHRILDEFIPGGVGGGINRGHRLEGNLVPGAVAVSRDPHIQLPAGVGVLGGIADILHRVELLLLGVDFLKDFLQVIEIVNEPVPASAALGHAFQGAGLHVPAHADNVDRHLHGQRVGDNIPGGVAAAVVNAVGKRDDAAGAALEGGMMNAVVDGVV